MSLRVLVAEDQPFLLEITGEVLREAGHEVLEATDGAEAERMARAEKPDILLLDIMMPERDGREVARRLRSEQGLDGMRIVYYTPMTKDEFDWRATGADAFRSKTESVRELPGFLEELSAR